MDDRYRVGLKRLERDERTRQRLGSPNPVCAICGCANLAALKAVPVSKLPPGLQRKLRVQHHPAGRKVSDWTDPVCRNCAAVLDDDRYDWDSRLLSPRTRLERICAHLKGMADLRRHQAQASLEEAEVLEAQIQELLANRHRP